MFAIKIFGAHKQLVRNPQIYFTMHSDYVTNTEKYCNYTDTQKSLHALRELGNVTICY